MIHRERITALQNELTPNQAFLITDFYNVFYLTGFRGISPEEREAVVFIKKDKAYLFLPAVYEEQAKNSEAVSNGTIELDIDQERNGLILRCQKKLDSEIKVIFFEDHNLKVKELEHLKKKIAVDWQANPLPVMDKRARKSPAEQLLLQKAATITDEAWDRTIEFLQKTDYTKLTEYEIADFIWKQARALGAQDEGFATIVASGPNSSQPHHITSNRKLRPDEPLLIDCGFYYQGYTADLTRTVFLGSPNQEFRNVYSLVLEADKKSIIRCLSGTTVSELCGVANTIFSKAGLLPHYLHGLGHGVGLEVHEQPFLRNRGDQKLKTDMVITIEPGLYFPKKFGIRIEDLVLITNGKQKILSDKSRRELLTIK